MTTNFSSIAEPKKAKIFQSQMLADRLSCSEVVIEWRLSCRVGREVGGGLREEEPLMPEATYTYNIRRKDDAGQAILSAANWVQPGGIFNFLFPREEKEQYWHSDNLLQVSFGHW
jgi:hypothetical protein